MHARERDIAKYRGKYDEGYAAIREARYKKLRRMGLVNPHAKLSPQAGSWDSVTDKRWEAACMEVYAAMVDQMDQGIGRIIAKLKDKGQLDNTLILFLQDNGGCAETCGRQPNAEPPIRAEKTNAAAIAERSGSLLWLSSQTDA